MRDRESERAVIELLREQLEALCASGRTAQLEARIDVRDGVPRASVTVAVRASVATRTATVD